MKPHENRQNVPHKSTKSTKSTKPQGRNGAHGGRGSVRIISGEWRGRRLQVPDIDGLRPTLDRLRETLFNWLMFEIEGKRCLDVFAGSGALGLEALSRRARSVTLIEKNPRAITTIKAFLHEVEDTHAKILEGDALRILARPPSEPFDVVFLDPPFHQDLLEKAVQTLEKNGWLAERAWIYLEHEPALSLDSLPSHWRHYRQIQNAGKRMLLLRREPPLRQEPPSAEQEAL
ncbi:Conserved hypothetical protein [gamma proteobacterium HdN1]|nr:Conserved hypothetical protein [gamma proteobacterium HdN1]